MNIFVLDKNPEVNAKYHPDVYVRKLLLENVQTICTVANLVEVDAPYKPTHKNHPCTVWARASRENMKWLLRLTAELNDEYIFRFDKKVNHKSYDAMCSIKIRKLLNRLPDIPMTEFAMVMPEQYQSKDVVKSYRDYYKNEKKNLIKYTKREIPDFLNDVIGV